MGSLPPGYTFEWISTYSSLIQGKKWGTLNNKKITSPFYCTFNYKRIFYRIGKCVYVILRRNDTVLRIVHTKKIPFLHTNINQ